MMNSSASRAFKPRMASFSSRNLAASVPLTDRKSVV